MPKPDKPQEKLEPEDDTERDEDYLVDRAEKAEREVLKPKTVLTTAYRGRK